MNHQLAMASWVALLREADDDEPPPVVRQSLSRDASRKDLRAEQAGRTLSSGRLHT